MPWWRRSGSAVWRRDARYGLKPAGLGARDTLRTEMCFPLYGHELTEDTTPIEAGLDVFVALDKPVFSGRERMLAQKAEGVRRRLVAFRMTEKGTPPVRPHYPVWANGGDGTPLGETTSGTLGPSLGLGIGLAYVPVAYAEPGPHPDDRDPRPAFPRRGGEEAALPEAGGGLRTAALAVAAVFMRSLRPGPGL
jgi:glycine cleavage system aminomethyltransferase T